MADANETRDWRIYAEFAQRLIAQAKRLYAGDGLDVDLPSTVYALDSTTIDLCLSVFPWAHFRSTKAAVKMHTLFDIVIRPPQQAIRSITGDPEYKKPTAGAGLTPGLAPRLPTPAPAGRRNPTDTPSTDGAWAARSCLIPKPFTARSHSRTVPVPPPPPPSVQ